MSQSNITRNMKTILVSSLRPHPCHSYFFDDMSGDHWNAFVNSIRKYGVIAPIVVTKDDASDKYIIVSGLQRVRACRELGIKEIIAEIKEYNSEDDLLLNIVYSNMLQRGKGNPNPVKFGRCIKELERIHGIK